MPRNNPVFTSCTKDGATESAARSAHAGEVQCLYTRVGPRRRDCAVRRHVPWWIQFSEHAPIFGGDEDRSGRAVRTWHEYLRAGANCECVQIGRASCRVRAYIIGFTVYVRINILESHN